MAPTDRVYRPMRGDQIDPYGALARADAARPRSSSGPGPSAFFSCPRQVGMEFRGDMPARPAEDDDKWPAILGTAIHAALESALHGVGQQEIAVEYRGIRGHTDWLPPAPRDDVVVDWKSTTLKKLGQIQQYGISLQHRAQAAFYGVATGRPNCALVFIPRDGGKDDITVVEFPADRGLVDKAVDWLLGIRAAAQQGQVPLPAPIWARARNPREHCARHCRFFDPLADPQGLIGDGCPGPT